MFDWLTLPIVRLHAMLTSAAPMAPMIKAALPPPGVTLRLARLSRNAFIGLSLIIAGEGDGRYSVYENWTAAREVDHA
jgi:hypothetical protein